MSRTSLSREGEGALPGFAEDRENRCSDSHSSSSEDAPSVTSFPKLPASSDPWMSDVAPDLGTVADRSIRINLENGYCSQCSGETSARDMPTSNPSVDRSCAWIGSRPAV